MSWFHKKPDPISDRARVLSSEIAALEAEIKRLDVQLEQKRQAPENPRLRSTTLPHGTVPHRVNEPAPGGMLASETNGSTLPRPSAQEPIFEDVDLDRLKSRGENGATPDHYNELGVRKYDLPALLRRVRHHFRGPSTTNPKLVNYLAAGGIQGLRPLRYEKRVARNRFLFFVAALLLALVGIALALVERH